MRLYKIVAFVSVLGMIWMAACGVDNDDNNSYSIGPAPYIGGAWRIALLPYEDTCSPAEGFVIHNPIDVPAVGQSGNNVSAAFLLGGSPVTLTGSIVSGYVIVVIQELTVFIETLGGTLQGSSIIGTFNGQELPGGCSQKGVFAIVIGPVETPVVTGEWTLTMQGTAVNCDDPADEGAFTKVIPSVMTSAPAEGTVAATYDDPVGVQNALGAIVLGTSFSGGIADTTNPPTRIAILNGAVDAAGKTISGSLQGTLAFAGGNCDISGGVFGVQY